MYGQTSDNISHGPSPPIELGFVKDHRSMRGRNARLHFLIPTAYHVTNHAMPGWLVLILLEFGIKMCVPWLVSGTRIRLYDPLMHSV